MLDVTTRGIVEPVILNIIRKPIGVGGMGVVGNLGSSTAKPRVTNGDSQMHRQTYTHTYTDLLNTRNLLQIVGTRIFHN